MSAHTAGPWQVAPDGSLGTVENMDGVSIAQAFMVRPHSQDIHSIERKANARLIAAAPDLLQALQTAEMAMLGYTVRNEVISNALKDARAAIAKATGEAP